MDPCFTTFSTVMLDVFPTGVSTKTFEVSFISYNICTNSTNGTWAIFQIIRFYKTVFQPQFIKTLFGHLEKINMFYSYFCFDFVFSSG